MTVYRDGHPQICEHLATCYYGSQNESGCSYAIEERKSRRSQGLFIKDGICPAYRPKGETPRRTQPIVAKSTDDMPGEYSIHNYCEV